MSAAESSVAASRALDDLYRNHAGEVYRYAYAVLGNHADAEDVAQTTFVNALRALERGERPRKPSNWLITITHNIVRQRFRQQQARPTEVVLDRDVPQEAADDNGPSMEELVRALQRIPQSQREALVMRELEGRPYREIGQILGLSTGALETLLFRARRSLAEELENAVTCGRAELGLSQELDGRLSRKDRRRLDDHIAECASCARLYANQGKQRRAFKALALLPLPLSLTLFKGTPSASAAVGLPTIGTSGTAAAAGSGTAAGGGTTFGGLALSGVALKAAAVVAAVSVAGGVGYVGTKEVRSLRGPAEKSSTAAAVVPASAKVQAAGASRSASTTSQGIARRVASRDAATAATYGRLAATNDMPTTTTAASGLAAENGAAPSTASSREATAQGRPDASSGTADHDSAQAATAATTAKVEEAIDATKAAVPVPRRPRLPSLLPRARRRAQQRALPGALPRAPPRRQPRQRPQPLRKPRQSQSP